MKPVILDLDAIPNMTRKKTEKPKTPSRKPAYWRAIVRSLRVDGPQTEASLLKNLGPAYKIHEDTIHFTLTYYLKHGYVERDGRKYKLSAKGATLGKPQPRRPRIPRPRGTTAYDHLLRD